MQRRPVRWLVIAFTVIGLVWANSVGATAGQDGLAVVPSEASTGSELAGLFPLSVGGQPVAVETWSRPEWLAPLDPGVPGDAAAIAATGSLLAAAGR
jgi:UDP-N-acetylmuramyl pentapeptide phosphotransferase/UDP-N-acetylglucosamine-1-phosphate transferase